METSTSSRFDAFLNANLDVLYAKYCGTQGAVRRLADLRRSAVRLLRLPIRGNRIALPEKLLHGEIVAGLVGGGVLLSQGEWTGLLTPLLVVALMLVGPILLLGLAARDALRLGRLQREVETIDTATYADVVSALDGAGFPDIARRIRPPDSPETFLGFLTDYLPEVLRETYIGASEREVQKLRGLRDRVQVHLGEVKANREIDQHTREIVLREGDERLRRLGESVETCVTNIRRVERVIEFLTTKAGRLRQRRRAIDLVEEGRRLDEELLELTAQTEELLYIQDHALQRLLSDVRTEVVGKGIALQVSMQDLAALPDSTRRRRSREAG